MRSSIKTLVLKVAPENPDKKNILLAAKVLRCGGLVVFPTETVYGLGANLFDAQAVERLYRIKKRPRNKPFTVHISDLEMIKRIGCTITKEAKALIDKFWPGPLTIILKSNDGKKIGFRMPDNKIALELIGHARVPIIAPSANLSGKAPPKSPQEVLKYFDGKVDILLDGGRTRLGVESTVIDLTVKSPKILREGAIRYEVLFEEK